MKKPDFKKLNDKLFRPVFIARLFFVLLCMWLGAYLARETQDDPFSFSLGGMIFGAIIVLIEYSTRAISSRKIILAMIGLMCGLIIAQLIHPTFATLLTLVIKAMDIFTPLSLSNQGGPISRRLVITPETSQFICHILFGYFGLVLALRHADWLRLGNLKLYLANPADRPKVLDTSVIIDGRVLEMTSLQLFEGPILVPSFVVNELQMLSDSGDPHKRSRGKRGLDVLDKLRTGCPSLELVPTDYSDIIAVDDKLIRLCSEMNGELITNDSNLQKVAQFHQIKTINVHELASALRPAVYVGEAMMMKIVKQGKEHDQGVGYLEDGTMVVVDNAADRIGSECEVVVTSILQNPTGRLVFAKLAHEESRTQAKAS